MVDCRDTDNNCGNCRYGRTDKANLEQRSCVINPPSAIPLSGHNGTVNWMASVTPVPRTHWCGKHELEQ